MLTIAFCSHQESMINCLPQEFIKAFSRRGIDINTLTIRNSCDLSDYALHGIYPDIIIFSESVLSTDFINSFLLLKEQKHSIIFISIKDSESFNHSTANDYIFLLQPFYSISSNSFPDLWNCVCKAYDLISSDKNTFAYYHRPSYHSRPLNHILYFVSEGRCIRLVTKDGSDSFYGRLSEVENNLSVKNCRFIRVHQSYLVNEKYILSYDRKGILLITGETLSISNSHYYQEVRRLLRKKVHAIP
ncbi:MAG: LytTR family DNA-binding domain-containing protein [Lachnospiraceae bacterium]|nr:LytTR family DNA-binding domain-containing protein [Lachnospiraceae bacterium]